MTRALFGITVLMLVWSVIRGQPSGSRVAMEGFPLTRGTRWVYEGVTTRGLSGATTPVRARQVMEVVEVIQRNNIRAARVRGNPLDAMSVTGTYDSVMAQVGSSDIYMAENPRVQDVWSRLRNPADRLAGLFDESELILRLPLEVEARQGEFRWVVAEKRRTDLGKVRRRWADAGASEFTLVWRGLSGHKKFQFVAGVGLTSASMQHAPSHTGYELRLVEFYLGRK